MSSSPRDLPTRACGGGCSRHRPGLSRHQVGELADHRKLLLSVERACVGEHLHADVVAVSLDVRERPIRQVVDERRGVLAEHRDVRDLFDLHQCGSQVACEGFWIRERTGRGVDVDHRHGFFSYCLTAATFAAASINPTTSAGWDTIARWLEGTSIIVAPMRLANMRSASGGIASSLVATRYQEGCDFQAGTPITSSKVLIDSPC